MLFGKYACGDDIRHRRLQFVLPPAARHLPTALRGETSLTPEQLRDSQRIDIEARLSIAFCRLVLEPVPLSWSELARRYFRSWPSAAFWAKVQT
jgi:hypothetical protein